MSTKGWLCLALALVCASPSWAVLVAEADDLASREWGDSFEFLWFGAAFNASGSRFDGGSANAFYHDLEAQKSYLISSGHTVLDGNGLQWAEMKYGSGNFYEDLSNNNVLSAEQYFFHPTQDVVIVRLNGLARNGQGNLVELVEFYDVETYGELTAGMTIVFAGYGDHGDPSLGGMGYTGLFDGNPRAARGQLHRLGYVGGLDPTIWFMKYFPSLNLGGIAAPGDSGGPVMVELEGKLFLCGINDMVRGGGTSTWTGFEYFGYRSPDSAGQTVFEWIEQTIAANTGNGGEGEGEQPLHAADTDGNWKIDLSELLRVIQFFNMGGYHCAGGEDSEDGFMPGVNADNQTCPAHASDYAPQDWSLSLSELLRSIQFFNTGSYHPCPEGEDGYCPGLSPV